ncbi:hypothetical protein ACFO3O_03475 [Dokdonia ponticola]|uniref:Lipocalin-like domain-containing protein n=1 Tax=Dokdonia ponticola TaxID=2041041 RepID=A0ABV9HS05_9FLAO
MKITFLYSLLLLFTGTNITNPNSNRISDKSLDLALLKGAWTLDLSPENKTDDNFAKMTITSVSENSLEGTFYRDGVKIREGRINTQRGILYAALVSSDNSGTYNTSFYYNDGIIYGTTHSVDKDFLAVWTATKTSK